MNKRDINKVTKIVKKLSKTDLNTNNKPVLIVILLLVLTLVIFSGILYNQKMIIENQNKVNNQSNDKKEKKEKTEKVDKGKEGKTGKDKGKNEEQIIPNGKIQNLKVIRVVDGDTLELEKDSVKYKVRLIGVNTPESVHIDKSKNTKEGKIASEFTKSKLEGKEVELEFDVNPYDKYGRLLAYVYIDGVSFNEILLEEGYAKTMFIAPNVKYKELYRQIEEKARKEKKGIWKNE